MSSGSIAYPGGDRAPFKSRAGRRLGAVPAWLGARLELLALLGIAGALNLWSLSSNGWANTYYSAAVRSMTTSWHDFLFASLDRSGLMTVDKPPLSLWVEALSARIFGFHPLSVLVPQALMGVGAVALVYDLVGRRFGRMAGFIAGLALAITPVVVAVSRHNNPDELLVLCSVAALWCVVRGLETGRTRWLVLSGICVGLGFETKMGEALLVVPALAAAWLWVAPSRRRAIRQLLAGGLSMVVVGGAWPLLVALTPAADRPWISGTGDNSIWSLILGYNGLGRLAGQSGGPQAFGGGGTLFGGPTGPFRLLQSGLGDQAGWLLGFAVVCGAGLLVLTRLRRRDPRTGWLIAVGGAGLTIAVVFSFARGIFHPYYVSLLAPFTAALIGAGVGEALRSGRAARWLAPLAILGGAITELVVLGDLGGQLPWAWAVVGGLALPVAAGLALVSHTHARASLLALGMVALLAGPATWAAETVGHRANGTCPTGGPLSASVGGPGGLGGQGQPRGPGRSSASGPALGGGPPLASRSGAPPNSFGGRAPLASRSGAPPKSFGGGAPAGGAPPGFGGDTTALRAAVRYAASHGGGTVAVASQSSAADAILSSGANVAGIGGFSGRESSVSISWLAQKVRSGHLRWVLAGQAAGPPGDTRRGSSAAIRAVTRACRAVRVGGGTLYDCQGRAAALAGV